MTFKQIGIFNSAILIIIAIFGAYPWYFLMLTVAQLVFVPLTLHMIMKNDDGWIPKFYPYIAVPAFIAVILLQLSGETAWDVFFASVYFAFTVMVAWYGVSRFLHRGFVHLEELLIDIGLIYLAIGGAWYLAYVGDIDTGFSPIITWLTGIHFHYSAFLLPIFVGFLGRLYKPKMYTWIGAIVLASPIIVAVGITFSTVVEFLSVIIYIIGIYTLIVLSFQAPIQGTIQKGLVRTSFAALGISILFSLLYAFGNLSGMFSVTIDFMLRFHGVTNSVLFALIGIIGWSIHTPRSQEKWPEFPISKIRGKGSIGERILVGKMDDGSYNGLVDSMEAYEPDINLQNLAPSIIDFYENTNNYQLFAEVKWHGWFKPFAGVYRLVSRFVKQINLPLSSEKVEMTGNIIGVNDELDGRSGTRAWVRKANGETVFVALYSSHRMDGRTYMNIALPLPWSSMTGILELHQLGKSLRLTSEKQQSKDTDSGIYLALRHYFLKLPIEEQFDVEEVEDGILKATHEMWIFSIPFLTIQYRIYYNETNED